jgi:hypothetical protein
VTGAHRPEARKAGGPAAARAWSEPQREDKKSTPDQRGRELYAQRKQTIEPIFGIIKGTLGFRRFSLRGLKKVRTEWTLVTLAYHLKRLFHMGAALSEV